MSASSSLRSFTDRNLRPTISFHCSKEQTQIEAIEKLILEVRPTMPRVWPKHRTAILSRRVIKNVWFKRLFAAFPLVHTVLLLSQYGGMGSVFQMVITYQNHVFFGLLCAETIIVLTAFGPRNFAVVPFHWLDVLLISVGAYAYAIGVANEYAFLRTLRVFRLFTVFAPKRRGLAYVNEMFHYSMKMVLQSLALFAISLVIFSLIGFR
jgi:hypothetical protein